MDSMEHGQDNVSDPLKHLLSLDWESTHDTPKSKDLHSKAEKSKSIKKVRFSDEVGHILCDLDTSSTNQLISEPIKSFSDHTYCIQESETLLRAPDPNAIHTEFSFNICESKDKNDYLESKDENDYLESKDENDYLESNDLRNMEMEKFIHEKNLLEIPDFEDNEVVYNCKNENLLKEDNASLRNISNVSELDILTSQVKKISLHPVQHNDFIKNQLLPNDLNSQGPAIFSNESSKQYSKSDDTLIDDETVSVLQKKASPLCCERKRIPQIKHNEKQSMKLTSVLNKHASISNASELKVSVFKAWSKVKKETKTDIVTTRTRYSTNCSDEPLRIRKTKDHIKFSSTHAETLWKKAKIKTKMRELKKQNKNNSSSRLQKELSKEEEIERQLAFNSWKKKKDEMEKKRYLSQKKKQRENKSSMDESKKKDSEGAFLAWEALKSNLKKVENQKRAWKLIKEKEQRVKKSLRDKEALRMYNLWLEAKKCKDEKNSESTLMKPPWLPPGK